MKTSKEWAISKPGIRDMHADGFVEAYCEHGCGHHKGVHGCDGCCASWPEDIANQVSED